MIVSLKSLSAVVDFKNVPKMSDTISIVHPPNPSAFYKVGGLFHLKKAFL